MGWSDEIIFPVLIVIEIPFQGYFLNLNKTECGGQICPANFQTLIPLDPNIGLTPNQAVNLSLSVV